MRPVQTLRVLQNRTKLALLGTQGFLKRVRDELCPAIRLNALSRKNGSRLFREAGKRQRLQRQRQPHSWRCARRTSAAPGAVCNCQLLWTLFLNSDSKVGGIPSAR